MIKLVYNKNQILIPAVLFAVSLLCSNISNSNPLIYRDYTAQYINSYTTTLNNDSFPSGIITDFLLKPTSKESLLSADFGQSLRGAMASEKSASGLALVLMVDQHQAGYTCGEGLYSYGQLAVAMAYSTENSVFEGWFEGDILVSKDPQFVFIMTHKRLLTARFRSVSNPQAKQ